MTYLNQILESAATRELCGDKEILTELFNLRVNGALEDAVRSDERYQKINNEACSKIKEMDKIGMNKEMWQLIDAALSAVNERSAKYARVAYQQGFMDAVDLLTK